MGLLDDVLGAAVPSGGLAKPLMIAATALLAAKATGGLGDLLGGSGATAANQPPGTPNQPQAPQPLSGQPPGGAQPGGLQAGLLGGLAALVERFQQNGHGDVINSWIGSGQNQSITPDQLHQALGPDAVNNLSRMTGVSGQTLVAELSRVLPSIVDKLTPQGRVPEHAEMSHW